jgi:hypothetical protein
VAGLELDVCLWVPGRCLVRERGVAEVVPWSERLADSGGLEGRRLQVHHRVPLRDGGSNELGNLELLCRDCHKLA